jgi:oxygen-independent coproporphyrinogen-3 oxidase
MTAGSGPRVASLYIHVPFCARKCEYCAFYSEAAQGELVGRYVTALQRELELVADRLAPQTIFFGGGTPSLLNLTQWSALFSTMERLHLGGGAGAREWTVECNPATVSLDKARLWREHGVNRISMGVQSLDETLLDRLGRVHSRDMVFRSFDLLRQAGFDNLNIDLMFAIPGQTLEVWERTLDEAIALGSEHLSSYEVIYEEDTPLFEQMQAGEFDVNEELACAMYDALVDRLAAAGFVQYEIANFARGSREREDRLRTEWPARPEDLPAWACRHNLNYWHGGSYFGLGPSAAGYVDGQRTRNWSNTRLYCEQLEKGKRAIEWSEELPALQRAGETAAFGLRTSVGWGFEQFAGLTGFDLRKEWAAELQQLTERGWARRDEQRFHLTRAGLRFADAAAEMFLR